MKEKLKSIKGSIRIKLTLVLTGLVLLIVVLLWVMNLTFYPQYYKNSKIGVLEGTYKQVKLLYIEMESESDMLTHNMYNDVFTAKLDQFSENYGLSLYVFQNNRVTMAGKMDGIYSIKYPQFINSYTKEELKGHVNNLLGYEGDTSDIKRLKSEEQYHVYQTYDSTIKSQYIELLGYIDADTIIYMRSNLEGMQHSIENTNTFLAYVAVIVGLIGVIAMYFISRRFTNPILILADISKKMSDLDFEVKYEVKSDDEIGKLGESINTLSDRLENTISELKTANNELKLDNERKTQIDEMRKEFLSNVSHELKTPIALIQGYAEGLVENVNDDPESRDFYCEVIIDEARKMNKMVKKLLTLNQIEFGNNFVQIEHFDIIQMMKSVLANTGILFQQKEVKLEFEHPEELFVWTDEYLTEEVFTNFVSNALNHVDGEKIIRITTENREDVLRIFVFNTGKCIPEEELEKIWIKFYKVDKARTRAYGGNGIGLSIVSAIMKSLNRDYGVYNTEDGVVFWFDVDIKNE